MQQLEQHIFIILGLEFWSFHFWSSDSSHIWKFLFDSHWSWCSLSEDWIICISINIYLVSVFSMKYLWFIRHGCLYFVLIIGCYWKDEFHWFCRWLRTLLAQTLDCQHGLCWAAINGGESSPLLFYLLQPALIETCYSSKRYCHDTGKFQNLGLWKLNFDF